MRLGLHLKGFGDREKVGQQPGDGNFAHGQAEDGFADGPAGLHEHIPGLIRGHVAGAKMDVRHAPVIAFEEAQQHFAEITPRGEVEPPHDAEIDHPKGGVEAHEDVSGMLVRMEEAVPEHLQEEGPGGVLEHRVGVDTRFDQGVPFVDGDAVDSLQGQHPARRPLPIDGGNVEAGVAGEVFAKLHRRRGLQPEVHLHRHHPGKGGDHLLGLEPAQVGTVALYLLGEPGEKVEVAVERGFDAGPEDLYGYRFALGGDGQMNLGDGRGGHRLALQALEYLFHRPVELGGDDVARLVRGKRVEAVLKARQVGGDLFAQQVRPGRQRLAELDEARAEFGQGKGQTLARAQ